MDEALSKITTSHDAESTNVLSVTQETGKRYPEVNQVFKQFEKKEAILSKKDVYTILCQLRQSPNKEEFAELLEELQATERGEVDRNDLMAYVRERGLTRRDEQIDTLINAFTDIDWKSSGRIHKSDLTLILTTFGDDKLSATEAEELVRTACPNKNGFIDYKDVAVVTHLMTSLGEIPCIVGAGTEASEMK